jgi:uncharacterized protein YndB with AHSA1/START domain
MRKHDTAPTKLVVTRTLRAPVRRIFSAWTDPDTLHQWWGPDDVTTHELIIEPRVGGQLLWTLSDSDGDRVTVSGEVFNLVPREQLGFTWTPEGRDWPHASRVNMDLREGRGVEIRIIHEGLPDKRAIVRHQKGWEAALARLDQLVSTPESDDAPKVLETYTLKVRQSPISTRNGTRGLQQP